MTTPRTMKNLIRFTVIGAIIIIYLILISQFH